jgi:hypothetical protein
MPALERQIWDNAATDSGEAMNGWNLFLRGQMAGDSPRFARAVSILAGSPPLITAANTDRPASLTLTLADFL